MTVLTMQAARANWETQVTMSLGHDVNDMVNFCDLVRGLIYAGGHGNRFFFSAFSSVVVKRGALDRT